jgi:hypothetical protein
MAARARGATQLRRSAAPPPGLHRSCRTLCKGWHRRLRVQERPGLHTRPKGCTRTTRSTRRPPRHHQQMAWAPPRPGTCCAATAAP